MWRRKELIFFGVILASANSFVFLIFLMLIQRECELTPLSLGALVLYAAFSVALPIYLVRELVEWIVLPIKRFRLLIEDSMHELNTPVGTIKTTVEILKRDAKEGDTKRLNRIELACDRIVALYDDLEYFAKKEARMFKKEEVELKKVVQKELELMDSFRLQKEVVIDAEMDESVVFADRRGVMMAISNLLSNAVKYSNRGGKVTLSLKNCTLKIKDEGCGISEDKIVKIFDRYYRMDPAKEGRGIGLFLVKEFCDENGVELFIRSEVGSGSEFTLDFGKICKKN